MQNDRCALCSEGARGSGLIFRHFRKGESLALSIVLCDACGDRIEKHLKRAIPGRLLQSSPVDPSLPG